MLSPRRVGITVVIVTNQSERLIPSLATSLPAALAGCDAQVVVSDSGSTDSTRQAVGGLLPHARWLALGRNAGYAAGINAGAAALPPQDALLVMNPDILLLPGSVRRLAHALEDPSVGIAVPRIYRPDGLFEPSLRRDPTLLRALGEALLGGRRAGRVAALGEMVMDARAYGQARSVDWASGAVCLVATACLMRVGPWDESFLLYSEEADFAMRARDAGYSVRYVPEAGAVHLGGTAHTSPRLWSMLQTNRVRLYGRRHGPVATSAFRGALVVGEAVRVLAGRGNTHKAGLRTLLMQRLPP